MVMHNVPAGVQQPTEPYKPIGVKPFVSEPRKRGGENELPFAKAAISDRLRPLQQS